MWIKCSSPRRAARSAPAVAPPARWRPFRARIANVHRALAAGQEQTCDNSEPDTSDAFMEAIAANSCDGTAVNATCAHTCISGYVNGSVTCSSAPAAEGEEATSFFEVVPCVGSSGGACQVLHALLSVPRCAIERELGRSLAERREDKAALGEEVLANARAHRRARGRARGRLRPGHAAARLHRGECGGDDCSGLGRGVPGGV